MLPMLTPQVRQYLYAVTSTVIALLVGLNVVDAGQTPLWLNVIAAVLGLGSSTVAAVAVSQQRRDGIL